MRLLELECPNCGANLRADDQLHKCTCNYCGYDFLIYDGSGSVTANRRQEFSQERRPVVFPEGISQECINALESAYYFSNIHHMSRKELYGQLALEGGAGFTPDAAQYALDNMDVDWKENALETAREYYYGEGFAMSKSMVFDQLSGDGGEGFSTEEAQYAIDHLE